MNPWIYITGLGQEMTTHHVMHCKFKWCVVHSPMPGPWSEWPTVWDFQRRLMMRQCPCGARHPAAEEYLIHGTGALIHACCRKCVCVPDLASICEGRLADSTIIDGEVVETPRELPWAG